MISRLQQLFFLLLLVICIAMAAIILHIRQDAKARLAAKPKQASPSASSEEPVYAATLMIPNDMTGSLDPVQLSLALPADPTRRAQAILQQLIACWEEADSTHPFGASPTVAGPLGTGEAGAGSSGTGSAGDGAAGSSNPANSAANPGVLSVYFVPLPEPDHSAAAGHTAKDKKLLAVVDLNAAFPLAQPSGIEPETLSLRSMVETLHANFPEIAAVRFLVNGQVRATLAGHADLERQYSTASSDASTNG